MIEEAEAELEAAAASSSRGKRKKKKKQIVQISEEEEELNELIEQHQYHSSKLGSSSCSITNRLHLSRLMRSRMTSSTTSATATSPSLLTPTYTTFLTSTEPEVLFRLVVLGFVLEGLLRRYELDKSPHKKAVAKKWMPA